MGVSIDHTLLCASRLLRSGQERKEPQLKRDALVMEPNASKTASAGIPIRSGTLQEMSNVRDLAETPGGMHFLGTTPGGSKIIYDRATMMHYRQSPLSKTPPANLPVIPGVTCPETEEERARREAIDTIPEEDEQDIANEGEGLAKSTGDDDDVFPLE